MITMKNVDNLLRHGQYMAALDRAEKYIYLAAYENNGRNQVRTAKALGVARGTLISRLKSWGTV